MNNQIKTIYKTTYMTLQKEEYPDPTENLHDRPICLYMTDIPNIYSKENIEDMFNKISNHFLVVSSIKFVPCFYNPYDKKCAYVYFDHWFSACDEIAIMESHFIINTFYTYKIPRTWYKYWSGESIQSIKIFYCKNPAHIYSKENWNLIKEQNIFREIRRQAQQIRYLKSKIYKLEDKISPIENDEEDISLYHNIM